MEITGRIEVYDPVSRNWMPEIYLTEPRYFHTVAASNHALYVAGGIIDIQSAACPVATNLVEVFYEGSHTIHWLPDSFLSASAVVAGGKVFIAGGIEIENCVQKNSKKVYIYDEATETWATDSLSVARTSFGLATDGNLVIFAGGWTIDNEMPSDVVDIYNISTNTWTTATLSSARAFIAGVYAGGKFLFAGGNRAGINNSYATVDVFDGTTWSTCSLSQARLGIKTAVAGNKVFFAGGGHLNTHTNYYTTSFDIVDVLDVSTFTWSTIQMMYDKVNHTAVGAGNELYLAGGYCMTQYTVLDMVEIWDVSFDIPELVSDGTPSIYPNPAGEMLYLSGSEHKRGITQAEIISSSGVVVLTTLDVADGISLAGLPAGLYVIRLNGRTGVRQYRFIKM